MYIFSLTVLKYGTSKLYYGQKRFLIILTASQQQRTGQTITGWFIKKHTGYGPYNIVFEVSSSSN
jgi:hypothetical protein